jgi:hypothetical protein
MSDKPDYSLSKFTTAQLLGIARREPEDDPSLAQTAEEISAFYRNAKPGDVAVIRETYRLILKFRYTLIDGRSKDENRVYLNDAPDYGGVAFYIKSGKNYKSPTGQARLVMPSDEIAAFIAANPDGKRIGGSITEFPFRPRFMG